MIELFRSRDSATTGHLQGMLESEGIQTFLQNDNVFSTAVQLSELIPALCVVDDAQAERGFELIRKYLQASKDQTLPNRKCSKCGEESPGNFGECWSCGTPLRS